MNEIIFMVHEPPEGGFAAEALGHSIYTGGDTLLELREMVRDAVRTPRHRPPKHPLPRGTLRAILRDVTQHRSSTMDQIAAKLFA
jgi:hypothetical protein